MVAQSVCLADSVVNRIDLRDELPVNRMVRGVELARVQSGCPSLMQSVSYNLVAEVPPYEPCAAQFCCVEPCVLPGVSET